MQENQSLARAILNSCKLFSAEQLAKIEENRASNPGMGLTEAAVKFGGHREVEVLAALAKSLGLETVDLEKQQPNPEALTKITASAVYQYNVLPFKCDATSMTIVASDPFDTKAADGLRLILHCRVKTALAPHEEVEKAIKKYYGVGADAIEKMIEDGRYSVDEDISSTRSSPRQTARARPTSTSSRRRRSSASATASTACSTRSTSPRS